MLTICCLIRDQLDSHLIFCHRTHYVRQLLTKFLVLHFRENKLQRTVHATPLRWWPVVIAYNQAKPIDTTPAEC